MKKLNLLLTVLLLFGIQSLFSQIPDPTNLTAVFKQENHPGMMGYGYVELKWNMPQSNLSYSFKIFRQGPNDSTFKLIFSNWRALKFNDYNVRPNSTYSYYVVAYNYSGSSNPSNIATLTTPPIPDVVRFVTFPPKLASINSLYTYDADAVSNQPVAVITYSLLEGPTDATLDTATGLLSWTPTAAGFFKFKLKAQSNLGGVAYQEWWVKVYGPTGVISGVVTDETTNQPLEKVAVYFLSTNASRHEMTYTNSNGEFSKNLVEGNYKIKFYKRGFYPEFYDNKSSIDSADLVTIVANSTFTLTASLTPVPPPTTYNISGSVLDSNGVPVRSVVTAFLVRDTTFPVILPHNMPRKMSAVTDSLGNYQLSVLGGFEYVVYAKPFNKEYYPEFYDNKRTFQEADRILVNGDVSGINFVLDHKPVYNNGVAGLVKDFNTGQGVEAIVSVFKLESNRRFKPFKSTRTDSLGNYIIENLLPGNYIVFAKPRLPYLPGYYKADTVAFRWKDADTVVVTENGVVNGIDINLVTRPDTGFAIVNGKVKTILGEPVNGVIVYAINLNGVVVASTNTENDGSYTIENLPAGDYSLYVESTDYENTADNGTVTVDYGTSSVQSKDLYLSPASTTGVSNNSSIPTTYSLMQNYPNPFNPTTTIRFTIPEKVQVKLEVYNLIGQKVATLVNGELNAGSYNVEFNGTGLSSGIYLYRIQAGNFTSVKKMLLIK
jgi:hypothetical protein